MNCTDSGLENLRAISMASLIDNCPRRIRITEKFRHRTAQNIAIHRRHAFHAPVFRVAFDQLVDIDGTIGRRAKQVVGKTPHIVANFFTLGPKRFPDGVGHLLAHVGLKQHLQA